MPQRMVPDKLALAILRQVDRSPTPAADICRRAGVGTDTINRLRHTARHNITLATAMKLVRALGMRLSPEGELEWDDRVTSAIQQPGALRDQFFAYRQQTYEFLVSWAPKHGTLAVTYLNEAVRRELITPSQAREIYDHIWDLADEHD